jgi:hypothetical protein
MISFVQKLSREQADEQAPQIFTVVHKTNKKNFGINFFFAGGGGHFRIVDLYLNFWALGRNYISRLCFLSMPLLQY